MSAEAASARRRPLSVEDHVAGVRAGDRAVLARTITLLESERADHQALGQEVLTRLLPHTGGARRVGITGVPGVGKSTLIEALGSRLTAAGHRLAVLAVDPSSQVTGGSVLGDKTRMSRLASDPRAFVRPSPAGATLGGVAARTREALLVCEAAGYEVVLVETVGTGQSEVTVADLVDTFVVLLLSGAGDELQGIKRGVLELADVLAVTKAEGDNAPRAELAARQLQAALRLTRHDGARPADPSRPAWVPPVLTVSAVAERGLDALWEQVLEHQRWARASGAFEARRRAQQVGWMWALVEDGLRSALRRAPATRELLGPLEAEVRAGRLPPGLAARRLLDAFVAGAPGATPPPSERDDEETAR